MALQPHLTRAVGPTRRHLPANFSYNTAISKTANQPTIDQLNIKPLRPMCETRIRHSPSCGHTWIELYRPCKPSRNLLTCPDFSASQPRGPASIPHLHNLPCCTPEWLCPRCGDSEPDLRYKRLCKFRAAGIKVGRDASRQGRGLELGAGCCGVM